MLTTRTIYNNHKVNLNYYQSLGISQTVRRDKIIQTYFKSLRETSLDNHRHDQRLNPKIAKYRTTYKILSNDNMRKSYDEWLVRRNKTQFLIM